MSDAHRDQGDRAQPRATTPALGSRLASPPEPPIPPDEDRRLASLAELAILDTPQEERFDRVVRTAALLFDVPIAVLAFVDGARQWHKAAVGMDLAEIPRATSIGAYTILSDEPLIVEDLRRDLRFSKNPLVVGPPRMRFHAGASIHAPDGSRVGAICVMDRYPRTLDEPRRRALTDLARLCEDELRAAAEDAVHRRMQKLQRFFDLSRDLLAITDGERLIEVSPSWRRTLGWAVEELRRRPLSRLLGEEDREGRRDVLLSNGDNGFITRARCADGSSRALEWMVVPDEEDGLMYAVARDVTGKLRTADRLRQSEERYRMLFTTMTEGVLLYDERGAVVACNPSAERLLGARTDQILGSTAQDPRWRWVDPSGEPLAPDQHPVARTLADGAPIRDFTCGVHTPTGALLWLSINSAPLVDPRTRARGVVVSFNDVTARRKIDRMKDEFVSTVSHELRTPLASVRGALGLLAGGVAGPLPNAQSQMVDIALRNVERLCRLVDDILDVEKLDGGKMKVSLARAELGPLLDQAEESHRAFIAELGLRIEVEAEPGLAVRVDPDRFQQVMSNLLSNAAKFSPPGGVITVRARASGDVARIEVHDEGPGIPAEFHGQVFERFSQADGSDRRHHGGSGLGLAIVKGLLERMEGTISFVSEPGRGTTFLAELPIDRSAP